MKILFVFAILILLALEFYLLELWKEYEQKQGSIWNRYPVFYCRDVHWRNFSRG